MNTLLNLFNYLERKQYVSCVRLIVLAFLALGTIIVLLLDKYVF